MSNHIYFGHIAEWILQNIFLLYSILLFCFMLKYRRQIYQMQPQETYASRVSQWFSGIRQILHSHHYSQKNRTTLKTKSQSDFSESIIFIFLFSLPIWTCFSVTHSFLDKCNGFIHFLRLPII